MKNIKYFMYKNTREFEKFLNAYGYRLKDVIGFSFAGQKQYHYNVLKLYNIRFNDGEYEYFKVAFFKNIFECDKARLCVSGDKLSDWYKNANVRHYKVKDIWGLKDKYVIEC